MLPFNNVAWRSQILESSFRRCLAKVQWTIRRGLSSRVVPQLKANQKLPSIPARTRFAPSPTGYLHLGSLRTALYNYLLARATGGQFLLRIEDTDTKRTVPGAEDRICQDLQWAGLQWDEGPQIGGPYASYRQSERTALYKEQVTKLLESHHAYRCFCTQDRLDLLARERNKAGLPTDYDRTCMSVSAEESDQRAHNGELHVIRLVTPAQYPEYNDLVYGLVGRLKGERRGIINQNSFEDPILIKSDGSPTYHLANVVDDHHMKITHVIRGVEWMPSTPKHLELYRAFGWDPPAFAHVGLLQDINRKKMSKRDLNMDLEKMKTDGIFPEALMNFVALLGWSHSMGSDYFTLQQLINNFTLKFTKGNVVVNFEKLNHLQGLHFHKCVTEGGEGIEHIVNQIVTIIEKDSELLIDPDILNGRTINDFIIALLRLETPRAFVSAPLFVERNRSIISCKKGMPGQARTFRKEMPRQEVVLVTEASQQLEDIPTNQWTVAALKERITNTVHEFIQKTHLGLENEESLTNVKYVNQSLLSWLRWAIVDGQKGPSILNVMELLGQDVTIRRLRAAEAEVNATQKQDPISSSKEI